MSDQDGDAVMIPVVDEEDEGEDAPNPLSADVIGLFPREDEEPCVFEESQLDRVATPDMVQRVNALIRRLELPRQSLVQFTTTANGAVSLNSTGSPLLDLFAKCGAMRGKPREMLTLFLRAICESPSYAMRCLFYLRDVRGGQGERELFRGCVRTLAESNDPFLTSLVARNLRFIPEYGRFDDVVKIFVGTPLQSAAMRLVKVQLEADVESDRPSLLAKWLPSENASSKATKRLASVVMSELEYPPRKYRKTLSALRKKLSVVECRMSSRRWNQIQYEKVPSLAFKKYTKAFRRRDETRFKGFLDAVERGEKKVHAGTLYPYDLVGPFLTRGQTIDVDQARALDAQWKALPDFLPEGERAIVVVDTSGSMMHGAASVMPICVAVSLGLYIGERMPHKGFITFSQTPEFVRIRGETLRERVSNMSRAAWGMSTNLQAVFDLILAMSVRNRWDRNSQVEKLFIISDMQFDVATQGNQRTNFQEIERKYARAGLKRPSICFWNVNASANGAEVAKDESGAFLVSGCSPAILKTAMSCNPMTFMFDVLNGKRYERIH